MQLGISTNLPQVPPLTLTLSLMEGDCVAAIAGDWFYSHFQCRLTEHGNICMNNLAGEQSPAFFESDGRNLAA
jgi:hypothetical protein